jgi:hypothetical protein
MSHKRQFIFYSFKKLLPISITDSRNIHRYTNFLAVLSHSHHAAIHMLLDVLNHGLFNAAAKRSDYTNGWILATNELEKT